MIINDFEQYPDHRLHFYNLIEATVTHCFPAMLNLSVDEFDIVMQCVKWGVEHISHIQEIGLRILSRLITSFQHSSVASQFFKSYLIFCLNTLLKVLTDTLHKTSFSEQVAVIAQLVGIVETGQIHQPLYSEPNWRNNHHYLQDYFLTTLANEFKTISEQQRIAFTEGVFAHYNDIARFKQHFRDFLIQVRAI